MLSLHSTNGQETYDMTTPYSQPRGVKGSHRFYCGRNETNPLPYQYWVNKGGHWVRDSKSRLAFVLSKGALAGNVAFCNKHFGVK